MATPFSIVPSAPPLGSQVALDLGEGENDAALALDGQVLPPPAMVRLEQTADEVVAPSEDVEAAGNRELLVATHVAHPVRCDGVGRGETARLKFGFDRELSRTDERHAGG
eukprot:4081748-Prymnesium_polylepis.4